MPLSLLMSLILALGGAPARRHTVTIELFKFKPTVIEVAVGDTIVWENRDIVPHTATANDKSWDSGNIAAHGRAITIAKRKGGQEFLCVYHPNMKGKLVVR